MATVIHQRSLTLREAAERLSVSERTVRRLVLCGRLPAFRVGYQIRIDAQELEEWIVGPARDSGDEAA